MSLSLAFQVIRIVSQGTWLWSLVVISANICESRKPCRRTVDHLGYSLLSDKDDAEDDSVNAKKRQEHFEAETERILMDTYNSLYKCQEFIPMVCSLLRCPA